MLCHYHLKTTTTTTHVIKPNLVISRALNLFNDSEENHLH